MEAMRYGYVEAALSVLLLIGAAGSGKTHGKHLFLGLPPPTIRQSTPLAEEAIRALSVLRATVTGVDEVAWELIIPEQLKQMIAGAIKSEPTFLQIQEEAATTANKQSADAQAGFPESESSAPSQSTKSPFHAYPRIPIEREQDQELLDLIKSSEGSRKLFEVDWVYLIDSGGQPSFHDTLPLFIHTATAVAFFLKLNECLNDKPMVEYYDSGGERCCSYSSLLTNEQILHHCVRSMQSRQGLSGVSAPNVFVVGTHRDREHECTETRQDKDSKLLEILRPTFGDNLAYYNALSKPEEVIFPVNAKNPTVEDKHVAKEFRNKVTRPKVSPRVKLPLPWFVLEQYVDKLALKRLRKVLSISECEKEAKRLEMDGQACQAALEFLDKLNRLFYRPSVLEGLVFSESQVPLDKISELVELLHLILGRQSPDTHRSLSSLVGHSPARKGESEVQLPGNPTDPSPIQSSGTFPALSKFADKELLKLRDHGIITVEVLKKFPKHYVEGLFTPTDFLKLLKAFQVAAPLSEGSPEFVMPCLLQELAPQELDKHRQLDPLSPAAPLLIHFPDHCVPAGVFIVLVIYLQNIAHWQLRLSFGNPRCFYRNCVGFKLPTGHGGSVTLVDSFEYIEVHVAKAKVNTCRKACSQIVRDIVEGINDAARRLQYGTLQPTIAFFCQRPTSDCKCTPHLAEVVDDEWVCSENEEISDVLASHHQMWLGHEQATGTTSGTTTDTANRPTMIELVRFQGKRERINLPQEIGVRFHHFGILLLDDRTGMLVQGIVRRLHENTVEINTEILQQWLSGHGQKPVTWETLVQVLKDVNLVNLAESIAEVKLYR